MNVVIMFFVFSFYVGVFVSTYKHFAWASLFNPKVLSVSFICLSQSPIGLIAAGSILVAGAFFVSFNEIDHSNRKELLLFFFGAIALLTGAMSL